MREGSILYQKTEYRKTYFVVDTTMEIKRNTLMEFKYLLFCFQHIDDIQRGEKYRFRKKIG